MTDVRHFGIVVRDLERALTFYQQFLDFHILSPNTEEGSFIDSILGFPETKVTTVKLVGKAGSQLALLAFDHPGSSEPRSLFQYGPAHIALTVNDIEKIYKRMLEADVEIVSSPKRSPDGNVKVMFCRDLDKTWLELGEELR